ncbi:hypothetical protein TNCT_571371 [Trichonephila clavata]|uniref:Uncharacterized protein n=1 Tax=Trichonephila clavata TaxID=2740835 RepID=A0A8X6LMG3_TRICU|nr:hypothetical protein TNCT_571371 [Trichonephila clavata]
MEILPVRLAILMLPNILLLILFLNFSEALRDVNGVSYTWKTKSWSSCFSSVKCGEGHRVRKVSCQDSFNFIVGSLIVMDLKSQQPSTSASECAINTRMFSDGALVHGHLVYYHHQHLHHLVLEHQ